MKTHNDELYEILDDMNARIEEIVSEYQDEDIIEQILAHIQQKAQDFVYELQMDIDKLETIKSE